MVFSVPEMIKLETSLSEVNNKEAKLCSPRLIKASTLLIMLANFLAKDQEELSEDTGTVLVPMVDLSSDLNHLDQDHSVEVECQITTSNSLDNLEISTREANGDNHKTKDNGVNHKTKDNGVNHKTKDNGVNHKTKDNGVNHKEDKEVGAKVATVDTVVMEVMDGNPFN